jgi:transposase
VNKEELMKLEKEEIIELLLAIIEEQAKKIAELEARLNQNSKNSSKPPSSDGFKKPQSLRKPSGKKAGGQMGHDGSGLKLMAKPDSYIYYEPDNCVNCPNARACKAIKTAGETRYEMDINIEMKTTAHQVITIKCPLSAEELTGRFPENISGTMQYGVNLEALAVSLNTIGMVSINRTHEILSGVFGIPISTGTISSMVTECAGKVAGTVNEIKEAIIEKPLIHSDETGVRVDKKTLWAHTASTDDLTYIEVQPSRGREGIDAIGILLVFLGTVIHDCWASYFLYSAIRHGLCNAHLLRELTAVKENTKQTWAQELIDLLLEMKKVKETLISQDRLYSSHYWLRRFNHTYDKILSEALSQNPVLKPSAVKRGKTKRGKTGSLVDRLILHKDKYLLFFTDFNVPFDNNQAERDIRMFKVKQKVSGCFRTIEGANDFAVIMSFVGTARKRGLSAFTSIKDALMGNPFSVASIASSD